MLQRRIYAINTAGKGREYRFAFFEDLCCFLLKLVYQEELTSHKTSPTWNFHLHTKQEQSLQLKLESLSQTLHAIAEGYSLAKKSDPRTLFSAIISITDTLISFLLFIFFFSPFFLQNLPRAYSMPILMLATGEITKQWLLTL